MRAALCSAPTRHTLQEKSASINPCERTVPSANSAGFRELSVLLNSERATKNVLTPMTRISCFSSFFADGLNSTHSTNSTHFESVNYWLIYSFQLFLKKMMGSKTMIFISTYLKVLFFEAQEQTCQNGCLLLSALLHITDYFHTAVEKKKFKDSNRAVMGVINRTEAF